jgi:BCD family chlorophyll transporter-like MFS transporter
VNPVTLGWAGIFRLGLVQTALGAIVVLTTSVMNRVMVVEYALPAMLPGLLVALKDVLQLTRPHVGYGSDKGGRRTPWILGGMLMLALGGTGAAVGTAIMSTSPAVGVAITVVAFVMIGLGVGAAGTTLLVLLARHVDVGRRPAAASIVWMMMIAGFALTAGVAGHFLDPYSPARLVEVTATVAALAMLVTVVALHGLESGLAPAQPDTASAPDAAPPRFLAALAEVWQERDARRFTVFVLVSMLAYGAQDLILEPFAGKVFGMTPGASTQLSGVQHGGVLLGMLVVALSGSLFARSRRVALRAWTVGGCVASALALGGIALSAAVAPSWPLHLNVFALGVANGVFAVSAIASMMTLAGEGRARREGLRMGLWGAAQAIAMGSGVFLGALAVDVAARVLIEPAAAYAVVFGLEGFLFLVAAGLGLTFVSSESGVAPQQSLGFRGMTVIQELGGR